MNSHFTARAARPVIATVIVGACFGAIAVPCLATMAAPAAAAATATASLTPAITITPNDTQWG